MRVADYIWKTLADWGVEHVFLVTGGGAMHLNDALGREERISYVCNLHEQACAMAAEGYARRSGRPGVVSVTTGPGGTNALTGVMGAWLDSVPMLVISGQIKRATMITSCPELQLRQLGDQEYNIVDAVRPMTKYAATVMKVEDVPAMLARAWREAQTGRPGPVWIDVPLDIQAAPCEFAPQPAPSLAQPPELAPSSEEVAKVAELIAKAERPAMIVGSGLHNAHCERKFLAVAEKLGIPVLTSISGIDLIPSEHPLFFGRPGILGERPANFIMQNSDLFLVLGTRMGIRICGYACETVARGAVKVMVDADRNELEKPTFRPDVRIHADVGAFLEALDAATAPQAPRGEWLDYCRRLKTKYPVVLPEHRARTDYVSSYVLPEKIVAHAPAASTVVTSNGIAYTSTFQSIPIREGMRMFSNEACASMGYGLPAAIGAAFAVAKTENPEVICFEGDGSIQMNLQELQTLLTYALPVKLFVYNNDGYLSIKTTQRAFFGGRFMGSEPGSGVKLPSFEKLAAAYGLPYFRLSNNQELDARLPEIFAVKGPALVEVMLDPFETLGPKAASKKLPDGSMVSAPLEDMAPFLPREEFRANMIIEPLEGF